MVISKTKFTSFFLFFNVFWTVTAMEKLTEMSSECEILTDENALENLAHVLCEKNSASSVWATMFLCANIFAYFSWKNLQRILKKQDKNFPEEEVLKSPPSTVLAVVENVGPVELLPLEKKEFKVVPGISVEIKPDETDGRTRGEGKHDEGECLEPQIILGDFERVDAEIGERPQDKINERKPMVFVGGVSASTTPIELVHEFRKQGFNVTVLPRIRYGVSFGFCPDLVLSTIAEVEELLACERIWVKDRWVDIRPYIPKDSAVASQNQEEKEDKENVEFINVEDLLHSAPTMHASHTPPQGSPIHFGQPYIYPIGSPIYVPHQFISQHPPELPFHSMQTLDAFHHPITQSTNSMQTYSSQ